MNIEFFTKTAVNNIVPLVLIPGAPQKSIFLSPPLQECGMLVLIDPSFGKIQRRRCYCFSLCWTYVISQPHSPQLVFFVK